MYCYGDFKEFLASDEGQKKLIRLYAWMVKEARVKAGKGSSILSALEIDSFYIGSSWERLTLLDRLCELGLLVQIPGEVRNFDNYRVMP